MKTDYTIKPLDEPIIEFKDFGFKVAVTQELMYYKELLQPKFDLYEFVDWYDKRAIDLRKRGTTPLLRLHNISRSTHSKTVSGRSNRYLSGWR